MSEQTQETTLSQLSELQHQRQAQRREVYYNLVRRIGDGKNVPDEEAVEILEQAGKTVQDLERDMAQFQKRKRCAEENSQVPQLREELNATKEKIAEEEAKLEEAKKAFQEAVEPLRNRREQLQRQISRGEQAGQQLIQSCQDPELLRQRQELLAEESVAVQRHVHFRDRLQQAEIHLKYLVNQANKLGGSTSPKAERINEQLEPKRQEVERLRAELEKAEQQREEAQARLKKFDREQLCKP